jgi:dCMP deaminase
MTKKAKKVSPRKAISWDECFMRMAHAISERSKDPSTQVGAVVVDKDNVVVGLGYNGFPRGIKNTDLPWERVGSFEDTKYPYICHAEENAIYNANNSTKNCILYSTLFPCNECAKTIIQNGIKEVVYEDDKYIGTPAHKTSIKMFILAKVSHRKYKSNIKK